MRLVNLNTAQALQDLGYDGEYTHLYSYGGAKISLIDLALLNEPVPKKSIPAPRLDDAAYFLRVKFGVLLSPMNLEGEKVWDTRITNMRLPMSYVWLHEEKDSYEDALADAVTKAIEIIKSTSNS